MSNETHVSAATSNDLTPENNVTHVVGSGVTPSVSSSESSNPAVEINNEEPSENWPEDPPEYLSYRGKRSRPNIGVKGSPSGDKK